MGALQIVRERMVHFNRSKARNRLGFPHKKSWRDSVVKGRRTSPYISTENEGAGEPVVSLHTDTLAGLGGGRPRRVPAASLPRTMLSSVNNAAEHRTLVLARQEMAGWTQLQLEPSALRAPDGFTAPRSMGPSGAHLAATLYDLAQAAERDHPGGERDVYARVANRLSELVENVRGVAVDVDEKRQLLSIVMTDLQNTEHVASALSDGTLRFLALTVMESDPRSRRLLCLEEPENGMHPLRILAVMNCWVNLRLMSRSRSMPTILFDGSSSTHTRHRSWHAFMTTHCSWRTPGTAANTRRHDAPYATCRARGVTSRIPTSPQLHVEICWPT